MNTQSTHNIDALFEAAIDSPEGRAQTLISNLATSASPVTLPANSHCARLSPEISNVGVSSWPYLEEEAWVSRVMQRVERAPSS